MVSAFEFFMGFCRYYNSLGIRFEESIGTHTGRIISYLDSLGRMLGYRILSELSFSKLFELANKECPPNLRLKKPDMCWAYATEEGFKYELALESEQKQDEEKISEDVRKLLSFPAKLKVLYCAHNNPIKVVQLTKEIAQRTSRIHKGKILLIMDPWVSRNTFSTGQLDGALLNRNLEITHVGVANIQETSDGLFRVRSFKDPHWVPYQEKK